MISLAGYDFENNKACLICQHVMQGERVMAFFHDDEGDLQFACGQNNHHESDWILVDLEDVITKHSGLFSLPTVRIGEIAERQAISGQWDVSKSYLE